MSNYKYKMKPDGYYGRVSIPKEIFDKLNEQYFISGCTDTLKFMCANHDEQAHLSNLGIDHSDVNCDWFKIELKD